MLALPLKDIFITQPFGANFVDFYSKMGLKGHNGIDFKAKDGCNVYASHSGRVTFAGKDEGGGISVVLMQDRNTFKTIYYHLKSVKVKFGENVKVGDIIGLADNTGKYTTGDHLHFGMKYLEDGRTIDTDNGYNGAVDPSYFFPDGWDKSHAYNRYGRKQNWKAEWLMRFKNLWLHRQLIKRNSLYKVYNTEFINALVYGGWDFDSVINDGMYEVWGWAKKDEYKKGKLNFK